MGAALFTIVGVALLVLFGLLPVVERLGSKNTKAETEADSAD
jgi:hypothetical protein